MKVVAVLLLCVAPDNHDQVALEIRDAQGKAARKQLRDALDEIDFKPFSYLSGWYTEWIHRQWDIKWTKARGHATYYLTPFLDVSHK